MQTEDYSEVREWAQDIVAHPGLSSPFLKTVAETVLELLPKQTIAETGFDFDEHHLAGAITRDGGDVVMLWQDVDETEQIICVDSAWTPGWLTPNGKKYKLVETTKPPHPTVLKTEHDLRGAPAGTILEASDRALWTRFGNGMWVSGADVDKSSFTLSASGPYHVLRWGWEK